MVEERVRGGEGRGAPGGWVVLGEGEGGAARGLRCVGAPTLHDLSRDPMNYVGKKRRSTTSWSRPGMHHCRPESQDRLPRSADHVRAPAKSPG